MVLLSSDTKVQAFGQNDEGQCDVLALEAGYVKTVAKRQGRAAEVRAAVEAQTWPLAFPRTEEGIRRRDYCCDDASSRYR